MPTPDAAAARLLLFADRPPRAVGTGAGAKVRRYRLARLDPESRRGTGDEPRYDYLKRAYD